MRYIIIGAGAIGGTIGARLLQGGHEVVLAARGEHLAALRGGGLRFVAPEGEVTLPVHAVAGPGELSLRGDDVLILTVKTQDAVGALDAWAWQPVAGGGIASQEIPVFCALNGVASERIASRRFRRAYGVCVWMPATHLRAGVVESQGFPMTGLLPLGRYPAGADDTAREVAASLAASTFLAPVSEDIMRFKYLKLLGNLGNAVEAMCGPMSAGAQNDAVYKRAREEGAAVLAAAGIGYASAAEQETLGFDRVQSARARETRRGGGSSWQSLTRATGTIEADYLNGEIVLLGRQHGIPTPVNELLQRLANQFAADRRPAASITPGELAALLAA